MKCSKHVQRKTMGNICSEDYIKGMCSNEALMKAIGQYKIHKNTINRLALILR